MITKVKKIDKLDFTYIILALLFGVFGIGILFVFSIIMQKGDIERGIVIEFAKEKYGIELSESDIIIYDNNVYKIKTNKLITNKNLSSDFYEYPYVKLTDNGEVVSDTLWGYAHLDECNTYVKELLKDDIEYSLEINAVMLLDNDSNYSWNEGLTISNCDKNLDYFKNTDRIIRHPKFNGVIYINTDLSSQEFKTVVKNKVAKILENKALFGEWIILNGTSGNYNSQSKVKLDLEVN